MGFTKRDEVMGYEMGTLPWIIQVRPKWNHKCPCKRKAEGGLTQAEKEAQTGEMP